jgi:hypothetical protein
MLRHDDAFTVLLKKLKWVSINISGLIFDRLGVSVVRRRSGKRFCELSFE